MSDTKTCKNPKCGKKFSRVQVRETHTRWPKRLFCQEACRLAAHRKDGPRTLTRRQQDVLEDVKWIADTDTWENIARRVGYKSPESLARELGKMGEHRLASRVRVEHSAYLESAL